MKASALAAAAVPMLLALGCTPEARQHPTWADVQPILAGECSHCHGAGADRMGDARTGGGFRLDFYDMKEDVCAEATQVLGENKPLAASYANDIWLAITTPADRPHERPRMPPPPAPYLAEWEWQTLQRWVADGAPKGELPHSNRPARFRLYHDSGPADRTLDITAVIEDPDGDPIVGVLQFGDFTLNMDRGGAFSATLDTSSWAPGERTVTAVLCDGWSSVSYAVGTLAVSHAP
jgi:hypothetical protein